MNYDVDDDYESDSDNLILNFLAIKVGFDFSLHFFLFRFCQVHLGNILKDFLTETFDINLGSIVTSTVSLTTFPVSGSSNFTFDDFCVFSMDQGFGHSKSSQWPFLDEKNATNNDIYMFMCSPPAQLCLRRIWECNHFRLPCKEPF